MVFRLQGNVKELFVTAMAYCCVIVIKHKMMNGLILALIVFCVVLLIVSLTYVLTNIRHKERMALLEKERDPKLFDTPQSRLAPLKWGMLLIGAGLGFLTAFLLDNFVFTSVVDTDPIYPAMIFILGGIGLVLFYRVFGNVKSD